MGEAQGIVTLTQSQVDQLKAYEPATMSLIDTDNTNTSSGGTASGTLNGTWSLEWTDNGFTNYSWSTYNDGYHFDQMNDNELQEWLEKPEYQFTSLMIAIQIYPYTYLDGCAKYYYQL